MSLDISRSHTLPAALPGFQSIKRYWDNAMAISTAKLMPGEVYVTKQDEMIMTVLGSCVSACVRNPRTQVGGMNHFLLPQKGAHAVVPSIEGAAARYGNWAMEVLINEVLKFGGCKDDLEVKLFGGGKVLDSMTMDIGLRNIEFVFGFLEMEGIRVQAHDVGDRYPRKLLYFPNTGKVRVCKLQNTNHATVVRREAAYLQDIKNKPLEGEIDLF
ncbi:MAG: chemoreceptor glutamine deamidase CheD [Gammaproteobacteria bacterium]|nr:chemoreceptor glutamine deamidase CheD [Gammaproteobacteria bacterium]